VNYSTGELGLLQLSRNSSSQALVVHLFKMVQVTYRHGNRFGLVFSQIGTADPLTFALDPMLAPLISLFRPASAPLQLLRYRGCAAGWQPIGQPRQPRDAHRLATLLGRISPSATLKLQPANL